ncbi:MAG TPA: GntR family transcriptional regulator [Kosmotoga arenicorallina]|uniref:GntR family transcriptional regulator n=1 Tax=Kosmotoga arenicorallina TaxID=688066 RepID=A0A7C5I143_9BACT|nr:MAG: GntR family transcriptional regulator [Thermotogota bacterium]HHF08690.1 GntR family transcriptional regulator [Kosmotoga arenicorallina]
MWFKVDFSKPIYSQIKKKIKEAIMKGELKHGELIPSVRDLASSISVNPNTVARAYRELVREGVIEPRPGIGYAVKKNEAVLRKSLENEVLREFKNAVLSMKNAGFTLERVMRLVEKSWNG